MVLALLFMTFTAQAEIPLPTYPECGEPDRPDLCPDDLDEEWWMISYIPEHARESIREAELELGSGMHADRAWRVSTGRMDVIIAAIDSGVQWRNTKLVNKYYVHTGELPLPQAADGTVSESYDFNGDGVINVQDWAEDPRVDIAAGRDRSDDMLDPSDLIYTEWGPEWDGVDNDGNGYIDDISGWDFFGRDNDPWQDYQSGYGDHGDGVMEDMGNEGGDGDGNIGVCPNCAVLPIRITDTFVVDGTRSAESIGYAADVGAVAASMAHGSLSDPAVVREMTAYAFENGLTLVGVAGDENSYHAMYPAVHDNIIFTHSIRYDTGGSGDAVYSYTNTWNCNNFGMRMTVVAPSPACATGASANITGMVGLMHSAARDAGIELHAGEVYQIITATADDVWLSEQEREISGAYPSYEGWDSFFGYGRVNAGQAVQVIAEGRIPPWVSIDSPRWFSPVTEDSVSVDGTISALRADGFDYIVEVGTGADPTDWQPVASGSGSGAIDGELAVIDLSTIDVPGTVEQADQYESLLERYERVHESAVTIRIQVTDSDGRTAEQRKTFFINRDDTLKPGFPLALGASGESSPILVDMDGDQVLEIVLGTANGEVMVFDGSGALLSGWPVSIPEMGQHHPTSASWTAIDEPMPDTIMASVAAADLDGDDSVDVVAVTLGGRIYAWNADGTLRPGFPYQNLGRAPEEFDDDHTYDQGFAAAPVLADIDGDGSREIIALGLDSRLYVVDAQGEDWGPYPMEICHPTLCGEKGFRIIDSPTVGDVDGDGDLDIGFGTNEATSDGRYSVSYVLDASTGEPLNGWPWEKGGLVNEAVLLPLIGEGHPASMAFADLDGDGDLEISNPIMLGLTDLMSHDATTHAPLSYYADQFGENHGVDESLSPSAIQFVSQPAFGDLNNDGVPDLVMGGASTIYLLSLAGNYYMDYQQPVMAWDGVDGTLLPGFPQQIEDIQFLMAPAVADVTGDGLAEVIYGSAGYVLHAWDGEGRKAEGWPKFTGGWLMGGAAVGDIDGDGLLDVVITTREGWLFAWTTDGHADDGVQWASAFHDAANTGNFQTPLPVQEGPPDVEEERRCGGCSSQVRTTPPLGWIGLFGLLLARRYRRGPQA